VVGGRFPTGVPALAAVAVVVAAVNAPSLLPYLYYTGLTALTYRLYVGRVRDEVFALYAGFAAAAVGLYLIQLVALPEYRGLSGGLGVGTDDCSFFFQVSEPGALALPEGCQRYSGKGLHRYTRALSVLSVFPVRHPLDALFANVWGAAMLPVFVRGVASWLSGSGRAARSAFLLAAICPFTLSNSLVLVRDGWTATLLIGALAFVVHKRYVWAAVCVAAAMYLRMGSGALALVVLVFVGYASSVVSARRPTSRLVRMAAGAALGGLILGAVTLAVGAALTERGMELQFYRADFVASFLSENSSDSTLFSILSQPAPIRVPLSFAFFFGSPFLKLGSVFAGDIFVIRSLLAAVLFPLLTLVTMPYFVRGGHFAVKRRDWVALALFTGYILALLVISQSSLQLRHKTLVMPLYYVLVGYGMSRSLPTGRLLGWLVVAAFAGIQVLFLVRAAL
jgi:hypothetical protein